MTEAEIKEVERLVNEQILRNVKVNTDVMPVEDAIRAGAMDLFGEKYSGMMRVLTVPGFSKELCGGTKVRATGDIGVFKITSDESIVSFFFSSRRRHTRFDCDWSSDVCSSD